MYDIFKQKKRYLTEDSIKLFIETNRYNDFKIYEEKQNDIFELIVQTSKPSKLDKNNYTSKWWKCKNLDFISK